jgi:hypothetical protein
MVELRSEKTVESTLKRLGTALPSIFRDSSVEVFIPVFHRDLNRFDLKTGNYLFARSQNFQALLRLKSITGVVGLVTYGDSNHPSKVIPVEHAYVSAIIKDAEDFFLSRASQITTGSFVRILDGDQRDFCGTVVTLHNGTACVQIDIKTKILLVETPVRNLLDLSQVPEAERVFYHAPLVTALDSEDKEALLAEDLKFEEDPLYCDDGLEAQKTTKLGRQQTVTAMVKRLILTGTTSPETIAKDVVQALKEGKLRHPKNLSIVHGVIKQRLILDHFQKLDGSIESYRDVVTKFGTQWKFPLHSLAREASAAGLDMSLSEDSSTEIAEAAA